MEADGKKPARLMWPVKVLPDTRYRASLIAVMYKLKIGEVIDRAIVCYANELRLTARMEAEFPVQGLRPPPKDRERPTEREIPRIGKYPEHKEWFRKRNQEVEEALRQRNG